MRLGREQLLLAALVAGQWIAVVVFALAAQHNGWLFYQGGDETYYYTTAWLLNDGELPRSPVAYLWPYLLAPFSLLAGPSVITGLPAIIVFQIAVLLPLALLCVYGLASRIGGRALGYGAAALWIVLPYLVIPLWAARYHDRYVDQVLPQSLGLTAMADFPSMVALLVAAYCCFRALDETDRRWAALGGLAAGLAAGLKPANLLFLAGPALAFVLVRRARGHMRPFALALLPGLVTLAAWKVRGLGELPLAAHEEVRLAAGTVASLNPVDRYGDIDLARLRDNLDGLREFFWSERLVEWAPVAGLVAVARVSGAKALFLAGWLGAFLLVKGGADQASVDTGSFFRLLQPAFPAFFLLVVAVPLLVPTYGPRLRGLRAEPGGTWSKRWRRVAIASGVAIALVFVTVPFLGEPPPGKVVEDTAARVLVPVETGIGPAAERVGGDVKLAWGAADSDGTKLFYRVLRASPGAVSEVNPGMPPAEDGISCRTAIRGSPECVLVMSTIGISREREWVDRPPPGTWIYRVGLSANWADDVLLGDMLLLSPPVTVTVA